MPRYVNAALEYQSKPPVHFFSIEEKRIWLTCRGWDVRNFDITGCKCIVEKLQVR